MKELFLRRFHLHAMGFCCIVFFHTAYSQPSATAPNLKFGRIGAAQGFNETSLTSNIVQDKNGFIWLGADDGLYRYDGNEFRFYTRDPLDKTPLNNLVITCLLVTNDSSLWIGAQGGLSYYNPMKEAIVPFSSATRYGALLSSANIISMATDHENNLWVDADGKIMRVNLKTRRVDSMMSINGVGYLFIDRCGNTWIGTDGNGLIYLDHSTNRLTVYHHDPKNKFSISVDNIFQVTEDLSGKIWVATTEGVCRFDTVTKQFTTYTYDANNPSSLGGIFINGGVYVDRQGTVWACTFDGGLDRFNPATETFTRYKSKANDPQSIGANNILGAFEDNSGALWVSTDGKGLENCSLKDNNFSLYSNFDPDMQTHYIVSVYADRKGIIWIATQGGGTYSFDPVTKKFRAWLRNQKDNTMPLWFSLPNGYYDDGRKLFIVAVYEGLTSLNRSTGKGMVIHSNFLIPEKIKDFTNYLSIVADNSGRLWMGGQRGIMIYDTTTRQLKSFGELYKDTNQLSSDGVGVQFIDGFVWTEGTLSGLTRIDPVTGKTKIYRYRANDTTSISQNSVDEIEKDKKNFYWVATDGGGLCVFDQNKNLFRTFTMHDGLPTNGISDLVIDDCNNIWIITPNGISKCSYNQNESPFTSKLTVRNYDFGFSAGENSNAVTPCTKGDHGTLYFGTQSGLLAFHPDSLKDNPSIPPVVLTGLSLFNKRISPSDTSAFLKNSITFAKELVLSYKQNVIGFTFAALSYVHPERNQYAYRLDGFDKDWIYTDATRRFANYTNLDPGEYTFEVKGSNNDGVWNETPTTLHLIITPPYWRTWWFYTLCALAIVSALYVIYRYRLQQIIKLQMIRNNIASDLHDDIGSTLNSISVFSEVAKQQAREDLPALEQIGISSRKIIESMSDIVWTINPENDNLEEVIARMRSFAYQVFKAKKIDLLFEADEKLNSIPLPMQVRKNFYLIFKEATNNIVKYSEASRASFNIAQSNRQIRLEIRDNGKGFNPETIEQGNGIKNMKRRAEEIKAKLTIESAPARGTLIELILKT